MPKHPKLKLLEAGRDHRPERVPARAPSKLPACPSWLRGRARREFVRLRRELTQAGLIARLDRDVLAAYCQALARAVELEAQLGDEAPVYQTSRGTRRPRPEVTLAHRYWALVHKLGADLGLSPAARARLGQREEPDADWPELTV